MSLRVLGIITARGGSKGVPRKNIRPLGGKPLIAWTIDAAKKSSLLTETIVSTDDAEIARVAEASGCRAPFLRPSELATDTAKSIPVVVHALDWLREHEGKEFDAVMILQPTSPFRTSEDIDACISKMDETGADSVMSMVKITDMSLAKLKRIEGDRILPYSIEEGTESRSRHDEPDVYKRNCAVYLTRVSCLQQNDLFGSDSRGYVMPEERSGDINTEYDFSIAEYRVLKGDGYASVITR